MALADDLEGIDRTDEILEAAREAMREIGRRWELGALVEKAGPDEPAEGCAWRVSTPIKMWVNVATSSPRRST